MSSSSAPNFTAITPSTLIGALGQAFFSLSIGLGCMLTYASYFKRDTPLMRTAGIIAGLDTLVALMSAVIIFPAVFSFGMKPTAGPTLVFEVLPTIFHQLPGGAVWAILFFALLFMASLTSTISMSEISIAYFIEERGMQRKSATRLNTAIVSTFAIGCALSFGPLSGFTICGLTIFNLFDYVASNILLPIGGLLIAVYVGWKLSPGVLYSELCPESARPGAVARMVHMLIKWLAPVAISIVLLRSMGLF